MMMQRKMLLVLMAALFAFGGCGGDEQETSTVTAEAGVTGPAREGESESTRADPTSLS